MTTERAARTGGQPTLEEVAAAAGVSRGTVSRVVNNSPQVSEQAREAVRRAIDELGYVPNRAARTLVTRRTDSVALVISESEERLFEDPYFARIVRAVNVAVADTGRQLLLAMVRSGDERGRLENFLTGQHVDGVLMLSLHGSDDLPYRLRDAGLPVVLGGRPLGERPIAYVDVDNRGGGRQAVAHLAERGRTRIATISGPMDMVPGMDRLAGYWEGLAAAGLAADAELVAYADFSEVGGAEAARDLLDRRPDLDAIFAASDAMAWGALRVLRERGRQVPGDVAVIGFDDMAGADRTDPPLTTVGQPVEEMGREMTRLLLALVAGEPDPPPVILSTHLTTRAST